MDYPALAQLIAGTPAFAPYLAAGNDQAIADALNLRDQAVYGVVSRDAFAIWAASTGLRATIQDHADNPASPLRSIALTLLDVIRGGAANGVDFSNADNVAMLNTWVTAGAMTEMQKGALLALSTRYTSIAEQQFGRELRNIDVAIALGRTGLEGL